MAESYIQFNCLDQLTLPAVSGFALLAPTRRFLGTPTYESRTPIHRKMTAYASNVFWATLRGHIVRAEPLSFWITDDWSGNFYHWVCNVLPKLEMLDTLAQDHQVIVYLPRKLTSKKFILQSLEAYPAIHFRLVNCAVFSKVIFIRNLCLPELHFTEKIDAIRNRFFTHFQIEDSGEKQRYFLTRSSSLQRSIVNMVELRPVLDHFNFNILEMGDLDLRSQILTASQSAILLGPHGANLTCSLFASADTHLMEIVDPMNHNLVHYANLAASRNLKYTKIFQYLDEAGRFNVDKNNLEDELLRACRQY